MGFTWYAKCVCVCVCVCDDNSKSTWCHEPKDKGSGTDDGEVPAETTYKIEQGWTLLHLPVRDISIVWSTGNLHLKPKEKKCERERERETWIHFFISNVYELVWESASFSITHSLTHAPTCTITITIKYNVSSHLVGDTSIYARKKFTDVNFLPRKFTTKYCNNNLVSTTKAKISRRAEFFHVIPHFIRSVPVGLYMHISIWYSIARV